MSDLEHLLAQDAANRERALIPVPASVSPARERRGRSAHPRATSTSSSTSAATMCSSVTEPHWSPAYRSLSQRQRLAAKSKFRA